MSIWNINEKERKINKLNKDINVDILIIGAGMTGMTAAYYLKDKNNIALVDANLYGHGVTFNTTAKITYLQEGNYTKIKNLCSKKEAKTYLNSQLYAIKELKKIIENEKIECDFIQTPSYLFANTKKEVSTLKKEINFLKQNNIKIEKENLPNKKQSYLSYKVDNTYTFNPIKYLDGIYNIIKNKIPLYENTKIIDIKQKNNKYICKTEQNTITANKIILACHYPFFLYSFFLPIRSHIEKSYIIISKTNEDFNFSAINTASPIYSCRYYKDNNKTYQISLAQSHNTAIKQNDKYNFQKTKEIFKLKKEDIIMEYSNVDIISHDYMPYIGKIKKDMYISTGYNTWGMTNSVLGAKIITDEIKKNKNIYTNKFNPLRKNIAFFLNIPLTLLSQIKSFLGPKINKKKKWYPKDLKIKGNIIEYNNHKIHNKCPHLGCSLIFNEKEKTWDCPCHSSRFDLDGHCIKGPSKKDISI